MADTVGERRCIFLAGPDRAERDIAERLQALVRGEPSWPALDVDSAIPWLESCGGLTLAPRRGQPGHGDHRRPEVSKTTLVNSLLKVLVAKSVDVALCAPTGRAARHPTETTGVEAKTIHRLLETDPKNGGFKRDEAEPARVRPARGRRDVHGRRAADEGSRPRPAAARRGAARRRRRPAPSVGPGQVLADVIGSGAVPVVRLTEVFRQAATSRVIVNAHRINAGKMPEATPAGAERSEFYVVDAAEPEVAAAKVIAVVRERIPRAFGLDPVRDVQVLCPCIAAASGRGPSTSSCRGC